MVTQVILRGLGVLRAGPYLRASVFIEAYSPTATPDTL